jgi:hypothetical protein
MAKVIKNVKVDWTWSGDNYALKGFNIAITPSTSNPNNGVIIQATSQSNVSTYTFSNVTLDDTIQYTAWVQAIYDGADSNWLSASNLTVTDDGTATIETKSSNIANSWKYSGTTYIDGGDIYTGTVTAEKIATGAITVGNLNTALQSSIFTDNPLTTNTVFSNWSSTYPNGFSAWGTVTPTKETTTVRSGLNAVKFNVTTLGQQAGMSIDSGAYITNISNQKYLYVEIGFMLVSGSINGAGALIDWLGMSPYRYTLKISDYISTPTTGKWYTLKTVIQRPTDTTFWTTTLNGAVSAGATSIVVASGVNLLSNYGTVTIGSETINIGTVSGTTINLKNALANAYATGATVTLTYNWSSMSGFLMANYSGIGDGVKNIIFDSLLVREPSQQEIDLYSNKANWTDAKSKVDLWKHASDYTKIDGGDIYTGTVTANSIATGTITADKIAIGVRSGNLILNNFSVTGNRTGWSTGGAITTDTFNGNTVNVDQIATYGDVMVTSDYIEVDPSLDYEISLWLRETTARTKGTTYFGIYTYDANKTQISAIPVSLSGVKSTANSNFYWWNGTVGTTWKQFVGYAFGCDKTVGWNVGENVTQNYILLPNTRYIKIRYLNYSNVGYTMLLNAYNPQVTPLSQTTIYGDQIKTGSMTADKIQGGTLTLGGSSNTNGLLSIKNASGSEIIKGDNTGILIDGGYYKITKDSITNTAVPTRNFVKNPSFENCLIGDYDNTVGDNAIKYLDGWTSTYVAKGSPRIRTSGSSSSLTDDINYIKDGLISLRINSANFPTQYLSTIAGKVYTMSAYVRRDKGASTAVTSKIVIHTMNSMNSIDTINPSLSDTLVINDDLWHRHVFTFTVPSMIDGTIGIVFGFTTTDTSWLLVDCVQMVEGTLPALYTPDSADMFGGVLADRIKGGTLTLGVNGSIDGNLIIKDASSNVIGAIGKNGIIAYDNNIKVVSDHLTYNADGTIAYGGYQATMSLSSFGLGENYTNSDSSRSGYFNLGYDKIELATNYGRDAVFTYFYAGLGETTGEKSDNITLIKYGQALRLRSDINSTTLGYVMQLGTIGNPNRIFVNNELYFESTTNNGSDFARIKYDSDNNTYALWGDSAENSALIIEVGNDPRGTSSDVLVLKPSGALLVDTSVLRFVQDNSWIEFKTGGTYLQSQSGGNLRIGNSNGNLDIGCLNGSYAHFYTNTTQFYFDKNIVVNGGISYYGNNNLTLWSPNIYHLTNVSASNYLAIYDTNGTTYGASIWVSDARLKENIIDSTEDALNKIMQIKHRQFDWTTKNLHEQLGYVSQELRNIDESFVTPVIQEDNTELLFPSVNVLIPYITKAIQQLKIEIDDLKTKMGVA